jgi:pyruvate, orthophosphate dikinase
MAAIAMQSKKLVYRFDEGDASTRDLLGGKRSNLCEMARLELPIPPGFVVTTEACLDYFALGQQFPEGLWENIQENMGHLEEVIGRGFGSTSNALLVSVRSGAKISMPGMMDTILNLGINDDVVDGLASLMANPARPTTLTAAFCKIAPMWSWRWSATLIRRCWPTIRSRPECPWTIS